MGSNNFHARQQSSTIAATAQGGLIFLKKKQVYRKGIVTETFINYYHGGVRFRFFSMLCCGPIVALRAQENLDSYLLYL